MEDIISKYIDKVIDISLVLFLSISLIFNGICRTNYIEWFTFVIFLIDIIFIIKYFLKPYKIPKNTWIYILFILTFLISIIFGSTHNFKYSILNFILILKIFIMSMGIKKQYENNITKFFNIVIISTMVCSIVSFSSVFLDINIKNYLGDFFPTSVDRLYGTFYYPNTLALLNMIGIILSFSLLEKSKKYLIPLYINFLVFFLTISKSFILFFIFAIIILIIKYRKNTKYLLLFIPLIYNIKMYRNYYFLNSLLGFIIVTIICILIYYLLFYLYNKNKKYIFIPLFIILLVSIFPNKKLKINNDRFTIISDFMYLKENTNYEIDIKLSGDIRDGYMYIYRLHIENDELKLSIVEKDELSEIINLSFNTGIDYEYFALVYDSDKSNVVFDSVVLKNGNNKKDIILDYKYYPYNYIKMLEQTKYDVGSLAGRKDIYERAINIIKKEPLMGHGYGYFNEISKKNTPIARYVDEHSYILTLGVENGIISIICWLILLIYIGLKLLFNLKKENGIALFLVISAIIFSSLYDFSLSYKWFIIILFSLALFLEKNLEK